jgi:hypothetical protein
VLANLKDQTNQGLVATVSAQLKDIEQRLAEVRSV